MVLLWRHVAFILFFVEGESLDSTTRVSYLWQKKKWREMENGLTIHFKWFYVKLRCIHRLRLCGEHKKWVKYLICKQRDVISKHFSLTNGPQSTNFLRLSFKQSDVMSHILAWQTDSKKTDFKLLSLLCLFDNVIGK